MSAGRYIVIRLIKLRLLSLSREAANALIQKEAERSVSFLEGLSEEEAARPVRVPPMRGIDEEMREWSLYQTLEHDTIVNRAFSKIILCLARGRPIKGLGDPKRDVLPSAQPGPAAVGAFQDSVDRHLEMIAGLEKLHGTAKHPHPVCGPLDAHGWHGFFGIHLGLHRAQMAQIRRRLTQQEREGE